MRVTVAAAFAFIAVAAIAVTAQQPPNSTVDTARLARIDDVVAEAIAAKQLPGAV